MSERPPERELMILNALGRAPDPEAKAATEPAQQELLARYVGNRLIALRPARPGIKLVIRIARDGEEPEDPSWRNVVRDALSSALDRSGNLLDERSLYAAEGQPVIFLIMCRVSFANFHRIRSGFVQQVRQAAALAGARTMTLVAVSPDFHCFRDAIPEIVERTPVRDYRALLRRPEGQELEVKGSVFASVDPWLKREGRLVERDDNAVGGFLKPLVGFLNSAGGTLVIGVLETRTYQGRGDAVDRAVARYKRSSTGPHFCIGLVDPTFTRKGWDKYVLRLRRLIAERISPAPGVLIDFRSARVGGRDIAVVTVYDPGERHDYYLEENGNRVYYARQGPEVNKLRPGEIAHHREATRQRRLSRRNGVG